MLTPEERHFAREQAGLFLVAAERFRATAAVMDEDPADPDSERLATLLEKRAQRVNELGNRLAAWANIPFLGLAQVMEQINEASV